MSGFFHPTPRLRGASVHLRPLRLEDAAALAAAAMESREGFAFTTVPDGEDGARAYIARALEQAAAGERLPLVVEFRDRIVGSTSYYAPEHWRWPAPPASPNALDAVAIGYTWLAASARRTRCNTEAKQLLLAHAFDCWAVHRVTFHTDVRNRESRAAIERIGGRLDGILRAHMPAVDGGTRDSAVYSILRSEWPTVRDGLATRLDGTEERS